MHDLNFRGDSFKDRFRDGYNPLVAVFERKQDAQGNQTLSLLGQTEWTHHAKKRETFATHINVYFDPRRTVNRWVRVCVYHVKNPGKEVLRKENSGRISVDIGDADMLGWRDCQLSEIIEAFKGESGCLSYPFFGADKREGQGSFTLRGGVEKEVAAVEFVNVFSPKDKDYVGHEVELSIRAENLYKLDMTSPCDPVVALFSRTSSGDFALIAQSEWIKCEHNPTFNAKFTIYSDLIQDRELRVNVYDVDTAAWEKDKLAANSTCPQINAMDGALAQEESLVGVAHTSLQALLVNSALDDETRVLLTYPAALASNQAAGADQSNQQVANLWYKSKRLDDKKSVIAIKAKVYHSVIKNASHRVYHNKHLETPEIGSQVTIMDVKTKAIDQRGHEVTLSLSAEHLLKFDWHSRSDPLVALFELVPQAHQVSLQHTKGGWECTICTYVNALSFLACEMCGSQKAAEAREIKATAPQAARPVTLEPCLLDQTEWVANNDKPVFSKKLSLYFDPDHDIRLRFAVYDVDTTHVTASNMIGSCDIALSELVSYDGGSHSLPLHHNDKGIAENLSAKKSVLKIAPTLQFAITENKAKKVTSPPPGSRVSFGSLSGGRVVKSTRGRGSIAPQVNRELIITAAVTNLLKMDWCSKSDPIVAVFEQGPDGSFDKMIAQTEWLKDTHEGVFITPLTIKQTTNPNDLLRFCVFNVDSNAIREQDLMGYVDISRGQLADSALEIEFPEVDLDDFFSARSMQPVKPPIPEIADANGWQKRLQLRNSEQRTIDQMLQNKSSNLLLHIISQKTQVTANILGMDFF